MLPSQFLFVTGSSAKKKIELFDHANRIVCPFYEREVKSWEAERYDM